MRDLLSACERDRDWAVALIRELVACESPSTDPAALEACAVTLSARCAEAGASVERLPAGSTTADHVLARWPGDGPSILLVGHFDTVWPVGQLARMPIREEHGALFGPGVLDMKAGLGIGLLAMRALGAGAHSGRARVSLLATSDEEVGSGTSRAALEELAKESAAVLVLEPALPGGRVKTARKGVGEFEVIVSGVASHAGVDPAAGASAIHELARLVSTLESLNDRGRGLSVNVGVIAGGTRSNVVAESARAKVDVRVARKEDAAGIEAAIRALRPVDHRVRVHVTGGITRPPMERTPGVARLYALAREVARDLGRDLEEGATGGASDGNFTAALGVPTLDGLGAVGDGPHAIHEHIIVKELPWRAALVAGLITRIGDN